MSPRSTSIHICTKRHRACMQRVCIQIHTCLCWYLVYRWVLYVCRYMHLCMYTWKTPWVDSDTLCAHRNTCTRICVWAWVCMCTHVYTYIWTDTVCVYESTYLCVYTCIYVRRLHMWVRKYLNVCMRVWIYWHVCWYVFTCMYTRFTVVCTPSLHVCVHIFTYMYACTFSHRVLMCDF